ncbi:MULTISPECIES: sorbosone dehydrogenase family protein [unclassified Duganella]|uniref:PQQ-dependent sugar dehydrogenase n=1 Tax=unclassified Duganella TaxID=2636909 RepID=UPI00088059F6|nr:MULTISPECIES: PQQ-dependent sugar dehydrogenase [unclassified Duganella]SDH16932.1 Glucose/arabinose dehydrogenase, beta-propeller fold [Duganella sp. OV458]SDK31489.1 Glucose/arabinose dehydrogenase, beta-propeller fold [Duganella sp. OV510]
MLKEVCAAMAAFSIAGCGGSSGSGSATTPLPPTTPTTPIGGPISLATGLQIPWSIAFYGSTPLVSERGTARIQAVGANGALTTVATIAGVSGSGEGGLLGIAVRDNFLYAYFTAGAENRIERYPLTGTGTAVRLGTAQTLLGGIPSGSNHNGGRIAFGPDGMLYAATGDAGTSSRSQNLSSLSGKILRMTAEGRVPADNPFSGSYVYSYGHRNVQGLAWASDGSMYASEFGQNTWDELNQIKAGGNYGWPDVEGKAGNSKYTDPLQQWATADASPSGIAISGGNIYIANLRGERLRKVPLAATSTATEFYVKEYGRLRDVVVAPDGRLYVLTNNTDGRGTPKAGDDRVLSVPVL